MTIKISAKKSKMECVAVLPALIVKNNFGSTEINVAFGKTMYEFYFEKTGKRIPV